MTSPKPIRELFVSDVTRDIAPVVYFHEQTPAMVAQEVGEYIITGGWPQDHPNHKRVPDGIHEQYVRLLKAISKEMDKPNGPELPNAWISGFYGSGKSSFAKLLGLALDGLALPEGGSVAEALLARDTSPNKAALKQAWSQLRAKLDPVAVIFDVGAAARDDEHIHSVALRQTQVRLGYSSKSVHIAREELEIERAGRWQEFLDLCQATFDAPWETFKDAPQAQGRFSKLMALVYPDIYANDRDWHMRHGGHSISGLSPEETVQTLGQMLDFRRKGATLFLVVDEVSQYVLSSKDRVDRLRAFATSLGSSLKGKAWLLALGQQKLDEGADHSFLVWAKDRFPSNLRVHLAPTNIRDVVHRRLLQKTEPAQTLLRELFDKHRADLKLFAYGCEDVTPDAFIETYPMLPGHIDLLLQITTALRTRSTRAQGDDQAIRGLLQLLGELFRSQKLADEPVGALVTLDAIYEVQHTALDADVQASMARVLDKCSEDADADSSGPPLTVRAAKAVALLELISDEVPTDAKLVAQALFDRVDRGNNVGAVTEALETLRRRNLLGYSEKTGYKLQSSAGEEWERERREFGAGTDVINELIQEGLTRLLAKPDKPKLQGRPFPWAGVFSDGRRADDVTVLDPRDKATVRVDFRLLAAKDRVETNWAKLSAEGKYTDRLIWLCGDAESLRSKCREYEKSRRMVNRYKPRRDSLNPARRMLLTQEENRLEDFADEVRECIEVAWMGGKMFFRGRPIAPSDKGTSFAVALHAAGEGILGELFPHFISLQIQPTELLQLVERELPNGLSPKFLGDALGILGIDGGRYVATCDGVVPRRLQDFIEQQDTTGIELLHHFGGPPYGYTANVIKACVLGLLRAAKLKVAPDAGEEITAVRDAGVQDLFTKDRDFRKATFSGAGPSVVGRPTLVKICKFLEQVGGAKIDREFDAVADAVMRVFPDLAADTRSVLERLRDTRGRRQECGRQRAGPAHLGPGGGLGALSGGGV